MRKRVIFLLLIFALLLVTAWVMLQHRAGRALPRPPSLQSLLSRFTGASPEEASDNAGTGSAAGTVEITYPASMFSEEDRAGFDPDEFAAKYGYERAVVNGDGSLTITMTEKQRSALMRNAVSQAEDALTAMVESTDTPYITAVYHDTAYRWISFVVDDDAFAAAGLDTYYIPWTAFQTALPCLVLRNDDYTCAIHFYSADRSYKYTVSYPEALTRPPLNFTRSGAYDSSGEYVYDRAGAFVPMQVIASLSDEDFISLCRDTIQPILDAGYRYAILDYGDGTALVFEGSIDGVITYGAIDSSRELTYAYRYYRIEDGAVTWEAA